MTAFVRKYYHTGTIRAQRIHVFNLHFQYTDMVNLPKRTFRFVLAVNLSNFFFKRRTTEQNQL